MPWSRSHYCCFLLQKRQLVLPTPEFDELPEDLQKVIDDRTQLDRKIYSRAEELLDEKIEFCKTVRR